MPYVKCSVAAGGRLVAATPSCVGQCRQGVLASPQWGRWRGPIRGPCLPKFPGRISQAHIGNKLLISLKRSYPQGFLKGLNFSGAAPDRATAPGRAVWPQRRGRSSPRPRGPAPSLPSSQDTAVDRSPSKGADFSALSGRGFCGQCSGQIKAKWGRRALAGGRQALGA